MVLNFVDCRYALDPCNPDRVSRKLGKIWLDVKTRNTVKFAGVTVKNENSLLVHPSIASLITLFLR